MQIDEIIKTAAETKVPDWLENHPHNSEDRRNEKTNAIYLAKNHLSWNGQLQSAGTFTFDKRLILTKDGLTRSEWLLPELFSAAEISYHNNDSWKEGYFQFAVGVKNS